MPRNCVICLECASPVGGVIFGATQNPTPGAMEIIRRHRKGTGHRQYRIARIQDDEEVDGLKVWGGGRTSWRG
jgi:hypothetical protein